MSTSGPRLSRTSKGYAEAKFNGKTVHFGKSDDPSVHLRFAHFITAWRDRVAWRVTPYAMS